MSDCYKGLSGIIFLISTYYYLVFIHSNACIACFPYYITFPYYQAPTCSPQRCWRLQHRFYHVLWTLSVRWPWKWSACLPEDLSVIYNKIGWTFHLTFRPCTSRAKPWPWCTWEDTGMACVSPRVPSKGHSSIAWKIKGVFLLHDFIDTLKMNPITSLVRWPKDKSADLLFFFSCYFFIHMHAKRGLWNQPLCSTWLCKDLWFLNGPFDIRLAKVTQPDLWKSGQMFFHSGSTNVLFVIMHYLYYSGI